MWDYDMGESLNIDDKYIEFGDARYVRRPDKGANMWEEYLKAGTNDYRSDGRIVEMKL